MCYETSQSPADPKRTEDPCRLARLQRHHKHLDAQGCIKRHIHGRTLEHNGLDVSKKRRDSDEEGSTNEEQKYVTYFGPDS